MHKEDNKKQQSSRRIYSRFGAQLIDSHWIAAATPGLKTNCCFCCPRAFWCATIVAMCTASAGVGSISSESRFWHEHDLPSEMRAQEKCRVRPPDSVH